ncbi:transcription factor Vhr1p [[Candida] railenensis]|uniref:Transcription factor Vhr1p n=1 Tax=[Candida] railenensis TaxID=45579 RepID=A0A9P0QV37_9ASCO|nr:transcription factor Vhr1p [[Candida] railenensis]
MSNDLNSKRLGITYQIRTKLNFLDERLWKRFSARRLELIDTLELSSKKASEQEDEIRNVAETLRKEFNYTEDYFNDFDRLVRAAIQSVRRNRKRSYRSKKGSAVTMPSAAGATEALHGSESPEFSSKRHKMFSAYHDISPSSGTSVSPTNELVVHTVNMSLGHGNVPDSGANSSVESTLGLGVGDHKSSVEPGHTTGGESDFSSVQRNKFISEISRLNSDSQEETINYPRSRNFTTFDRSRGVIDSMITPRISQTPSNAMATSTNAAKKNMHDDKVSASIPVLPPITNFHSHKDRLSHPPSPSSAFFNGSYQVIGKPSSSGVVDKSHSATLLLLSFIERSKTCSESTAYHNTENLQILGRAAMTCVISFLFEKSFYMLNATSIVYLRDKLLQDQYLARIFRELDPSTVSNIVALNDETAVVSLCTLLGGCVKDFGFDSILFALCEIVYHRVIKEYPLIAKNAIEFKREHKEDLTPRSDPQDSDEDMSQKDSKDIYDGLSQLNSLAAIATDIQSQEKKLQEDRNRYSDPLNKKVTLKFLTSVLEFTYPAGNSAYPRLVEMIENGKAAFKLPMDNDSLAFSLKNAQDGSPIGSDLDLEKIFKNSNLIELEMFVRRAKDIPISELTSTVLPTGGPPKVLLPPPFGARTSPLSSSRINGGVAPLNPIPMGGFKFLSNLEDSPLPPPVLPKFQPLL